MFDPTGLGTNTVEKLEAFVEKGGSLLILLGRKLGDANRVQTTPVARLLPGKIERLAVNENRDRMFCLNPVLTSHPIFHPLDDLVEEAPWVQYPVFSYWAFSDLRPMHRLSFDTRLAFIQPFWMKLEAAVELSPGQLLFRKPSMKNQGFPGINFGMEPMNLGRPSGCCSVHCDICRDGGTAS